MCRVEQCEHYRVSDGGEESLAEVPNTEKKENDLEGCCEGKQNIEVWRSISTATSSAENAFCLHSFVVQLLTPARMLWESERSTEWWENIFL